MKKILTLLLAISMLSIFMVGCAPSQEVDDDVKNVNLEEIHEAVKESMGEFYGPDMELSEEELENLIGVESSDIEEYVAEVPMMNVSIDTFIAIKAAEGKADTIEAALEEYRTYLVEDSFQYPMNMAKVNSAKIVRHDDYLFFLMLGQYDEREEATEEERLEFAQDEIKKIEDVINTFFE